MPFSLGFWATAGAGGGAGGGAFEQISTTILTGTSTGITFSSIPSTYKHLELRFTVAGDTSNYPAILRLNGVSTSSYSRHRLTGNGSSVSSDAASSQTSIAMGTYPNPAEGSSVFAGGVLQILDYANTTTNKTIRVLMGARGSSLANITLGSGAFLSTSAVSSLTIAPLLDNFVAGSRFTLYGIKG